MPEKDDTLPPLPPRRERSGQKKAALASATVAALTPDVLADIKEKLGVDFKIRSSDASVDTIASSIDPNVGVAREYDKVYDRTSPGYDRVYDRG